MVNKNGKLSLVESIFSITNTNDKRHKIFTILGLKVKLKRKVKDYFNPRVSIIVPNYNHAKYLTKRLNSIYSQTYKNYEVILLDDCSTDNSVEILKRYCLLHKKNTKFYENSVNSGGVFYQWKKGLELAKGDLIWIAESDDWCDKNFLKTLVSSFKDESVMISFAKTLFMTNGKQTWSINAYLNDLKYNFDKPFIETAHLAINNGFGFKNIIPNVSSAIFRNTGFASIINNRDWYNLKLCGDWMFYLDLIKGGKIAYNPSTINYYRKHNSNTSKSVKQTVNYFKEHEFISKYISENYKVSKDIYEKQFNVLSKFISPNGPVKTIEELKECYNIEKLNSNCNRKLNVMIGSLGFCSGGGETFPIFLANQLRKLGHNITFFVYNEKRNNQDIKALLDKSIPIIYRKNYSFSKIVANFGIDVIHTGHLALDYDVAKSHIGKTCKHLVTLHGMYEAVDEDYISSRLPMLKRNVDKWMYIADKNLIPFKRVNINIDNSFSKIINGLPKTDIKPILRKELGISEDAIVLCTVSRALPEKGWEEAIEAVSILRNRMNKDFHLLLLGDGEMYEKLKNNVPNYVHLLGFKRNTRDYIAMSDIFLLASRYKGESFPLVVIDALFCGKPVIASDIGEIRNMLTVDGKVPGAIFSLNKNSQIDIVKLADTIQYFIENNKRDYQTIINILKDKYDIENVALEYLKYYKELINSISKKQDKIYIAGAMPSSNISLKSLNLPENRYKVGYNTGNLIIGDFSRFLLNKYKHQDSIAFPFEFSKDLGYINNNCKRIVILATNWLAKYNNADYSYLNEVIPKIKVPITIIGLGSNLKLDELNKEGMQGFMKNINPSFIKFLQLCSDKSESISVRGFITAELLKYIGINNIDVTGCPTWYVNKDYNVKIRKRQIDTDSKILFTANQDLKSSYQKIAEIMQKFPKSKFMIQTELDLLKYLNNSYNNYENNYLLPNSFFRKGWGTCFSDTKLWESYIIESVDLSFGFRIHNTIISLKNGKPAIIVINDSRTKEMSEFYNIPRVTLQEFNKDNFSLIKTYENADFSSLEKEYFQKYEYFKKFMNKNGIILSDNQKQLL